MVKGRDQCGGGCVRRQQMDQRLYRILASSSVVAAELVGGAEGLPPTRNCVVLRYRLVGRLCKS